MPTPPVASHSSMPAQPSRPSSLATAVPAKKTPIIPPTIASAAPTPVAPAVAATQSIPTTTATTIASVPPAPVTSPLVAPQPPVSSFSSASAPISQHDSIAQDLMQANFNAIVSAPISQSALEQSLVSSMMNTKIPASTNNMNLLSQDVKNMMGGLGLGNLNMNFQQSLSHMAMANQLDSIINVSSPLNIQNSHMITTMGHHQQQPQQHSNGFSNMKRDSPPNMLNNNGIPGLGMNLNMGMASIFDPHPMVMPMNLPPQLSMKKDDKMAMAQQQMPQKMDEMGVLGLSQMTNHSNAQIMPEKKMTPPDSKNPTANFASAFKNKTVEQNVKNASSWSSLAQASSPQSAAGTSAKNATRDTFQAFKKQAKEKQDRQRALAEQQEMRRQQKEQAERERLRQENERRREKEEDHAMDKSRKTSPTSSASPVTHQHSQQSSARPEAMQKTAADVAETDSSSPSQSAGADKAAAERERQRLREQERRRREAMAGQIDMNMQSDLMAAFEESL
ncbi:homeotic protein female sterile-like [Phymastichus coffea]|uniref:homeotic protein female sterile-like n=1 Tax=Phymastichus coffea TaxID=108790 RepID=UPI00273CA968|nr:homeotic protein female sterile-like [Phymastichus coffea]